jgi:hypothetical protein
MPISPARAAVSLHTQIDKAATELLHINTTFFDLERRLRELDDLVIELIELRDQHFQEVDDALTAKGKGLFFKNAFDAVDRIQSHAAKAPRKDIIELCHTLHWNLLKLFNPSLKAQI